MNILKIIRQQLRRILHPNHFTDDKISIANKEIFRFKHGGVINSTHFARVRHQQLIDAEQGFVAKDRHSRVFFDVKKKSINLLNIEAHMQELKGK